MRKPKTNGLEWLQHSINAFNGTGYANRETPEQFIDSYIQYKTWKNKQEAVQLAIKYYQAVLPLAQYLIENSVVDRIPSDKNLAKFNAVKKLARPTVVITM